MKILVAIVLAYLCALSSSAPSDSVLRWERILEAHKVNKDPMEKHWAVLVAGSNSWYNYRHQADICHAYQIVKKHGIPENQIITLMYDDIAQNSMNPTKGIIINRPNGTDVYGGVNIDYKGKDVTPENFVDALTGDGSGKVLKSGPNDVVFVNFADHGATGLLAFPNGVLTVKKLQSALTKMHSKNMFKKMVIYVEACESGSMFKGVLPDNIKIYATTASNDHESSYACYYDAKRKTYLGDVYSVKWMEDSDAENINMETLEKQFQIVKKETNTSHAMQYGDMSFKTDKVGEYQGSKNNVTKIKHPKIQINDAVSSREVSMMILVLQFMTASTENEREVIRQSIYKLVEKKRSINNVFDKIISRSVSGNKYLTEFMTKSRHDITNLDCHDAVVRAVHKRCFNLGQTEEALEHIYKLANLCENGISTETIVNSITTACQSLVL